MQGYGNIRITERDLEATRPNWSNNAFSLKSKKAEATKVIVNKEAVLTAWSLQSSEDGNEDQLDEEDLLEPEDLEKKVVSEDCRIGRRKPCKSCGCGWADEEEEKKKEERKKKASAEQKPVVSLQTLEARPQQPELSFKSACGSCSLGDAFRCGGCPFMGLPPFKPGERVAVAQKLLDDL